MLMMYTSSPSKESSSSCNLTPPSSDELHEPSPERKLIMHMHIIESSNDATANAANAAITDRGRMDLSQNKNGNHDDDDDDELYNGGGSNGEHGTSTNISSSSSCSSPPPPPSSFVVGQQLQLQKMIPQEVLMKILEKEYKWKAADAKLRQRHHLLQPSFKRNKSNNKKNKNKKNKKKTKNKKNKKT